MKTIEYNTTSEYIINKSRFITKLLKVDTNKEVTNYLDLIKHEYKDATHICYSFIIDNEKRFNDNGEPSGTAGMPILNVLEKNNLNHILCIVIRYFGGIKLGAGGLVRAYSTSVTTCLDKSIIKDIVYGLELTITFNYDNTKQIDYILKDYIIKKEFKDSVQYTFSITKDNFNQIENDLSKLVTNITKKETILTI